ncbi:unnamed protein product [Microthlaspi erraticum]|uniref:RRM domain-containing protein n=1 Tax=Microthlaspi erraticum TaxID=1685480 RepID=A0A6D2I8V5_9BRAS|nr:unnamed protein product [Microthlaspi erraticum]
MSVVENADVKVDSSGENLHKSIVSPPQTKPPCPDDHNSKSNSSVKTSQTSEVDLKIEISHLDEKFSKLNPMAMEFVPPSLAYPSGLWFTNNFAVQALYPAHGVTEEQLAGLFLSCGQVVDCRICGDQKSILRFAFIEFTHEEGAMSALRLSGTAFGSHPIKVLLSKTAIAPVNPNFLPTSEDEREKCVKTVYCTNIDKKVTQMELENFFKSVCGEVQHLRLLGDDHHRTRIAFVEFTLVILFAYFPYMNFHYSVCSWL